MRFSIRTTRALPPVIDALSCSPILHLPNRPPLSPPYLYFVAAVAPSGRVEALPVRRRSPASCRRVKHAGLNRLGCRNQGAVLLSHGGGSD